MTPIVKRPTAPDPGPFQGFIRPAVNADADAIRSVLNSVRVEYGVHSEGQAEDDDLDDIEHNYFQRGGFFEVVEDADRRIVGCAGLYPLTPKRAELCKMYLEKAARGRGLGRRLLEDMLAAARQSGFSEVWLKTNSILVQATTLYQQYGFRPVEADDLPPGCNEAYLLGLKPPCG